MEKLEHFRHNLLFEFNKGGKRMWRPEIFALCMGIIPSERARQEKWFSRFKEDCFDISDTPRSERPSRFDEYRLNTLIHNDPRQCTRELANVMNCDHSNIVRLLHSMGKVKKIGCKGTAFSKPKPQKSAGDHMCISACSSLIGS